MNPSDIPPIQPGPEKESIMHRIFFKGWLFHALFIIFFIVFSVLPVMFIADNYFQTNILNKKVNPLQVFKDFKAQVKSTTIPSATSSQTQGCYVKVAGYIYNMQVRIGQTAVDPNTGKTRVHTVLDYQCGNLTNPTDMTAVYLDKHQPMGCADRIAPFIVYPPAPKDPTCQ